MKINKKYIFLASIFIIVIVVSFLIYYKNRSETSNIKITPSKPTIKTNLEGTINIDNINKTFPKSKYSFPSKLPTMTLDIKKIDNIFVNNIKIKLGISEEVQEFNDSVEGKKYFVSSKDRYLVVTPKTAVLKYGLSTSDFPSVNDKKISDEGFTNIAEGFITNNELYKTDQIKFLNIQYLKRSVLSEGLEKSDRESAEVFAVNFTFVSSDYEIADNYSVKAPIYIEFLKNGEILNSEITLLDRVSLGVTDYPVKDYQDFIDSLKLSKVISLSGDYYSVSEVKSVEDFKEVEVENVRIAYYDEGKNNIYLQPIFIIDANIKIEGSSSNKAVLYLPAFK